MTIVLKLDVTYVSIGSAVLIVPENYAVSASPYICVGVAVMNARLMSHIVQNAYSRAMKS